MTTAEKVIRYLDNRLGGSIRWDWLNKTLKAEILQALTEIIDDDRPQVEPPPSPPQP